MSNCDEPARADNIGGELVRRREGGKARDQPPRNGDPDAAPGSGGPWIDCHGTDAD